MIVNKAPTVKARASAPIQNSPGTHWRAVGKKELFYRSWTAN